MPKNANGDKGIRQRADGLWEARLQFADKRISVYGKTKEDASRKLQELVAARDNGINLDLQKMTVTEWLDIWMRDYRNRIKDSTKATYRQYIALNIAPYIGKSKLTCLTGDVIHRAYNALMSKGLSPKTIKNTHGILHKALDQAIKLGYIMRNPCDACELPVINKREINPISGNFLLRFLEAIKKDSLGDLMFITLFTGLRESEVLGLTWDCVDFERRLIRVYRQLFLQRVRGGGGQYVFTNLKNKKERTFSAIADVFEALLRVKREQEEWKRLCGETWSNPHDLIFTNEQGRNLATTTVFWRFKRIAKGIGLDKARFHDLRHSYATLSIQAGNNIKTVSESLGHYSAAFTLDTYCHVTEQMQRENAERLQAHIDKLTQP